MVWGARPRVSMILSFWLARRLRSRMDFDISTMMRLRERAFFRMSGILSNFRLKAWILRILARICFFFSSNFALAMFVFRNVEHIL